MNTRPPLVTIAPPRLFGDPNRSGNVTPFNKGWFRTAGFPSPSGAFHAISPLFKSIAANTAQGGETSGRPPGSTAVSPPRANTFEYSTGTSASDPSFLANRFTPIWFAARTNRYPLSGSNAAPPQLAPPFCDGRWSVPLNEGGVKIGPSRNLRSCSSASFLISGVKSFAFSKRTPCSTNAGGLVGNG